MLRVAIVVALIVAPASLVTAAEGTEDPAFYGLPFHQWLSEPDHAHMHWTARVLDPELSPQQRLESRIFVQVDGSELARRRGKGQLLVLEEIQDDFGHTWESHQEMDLDWIEEGIRNKDAVFSQAFFVVPGNYRIAIALFATATKEHSIVTKKLRVNALRNDPLPDAWRDLPPVEFIPHEGPPDSWYLPSIEGRLHLAAAARRTAHLDLVVNLDASERLWASSRAQSRNLGVLLPAARILSEVQWSNLSLSVTLLDLAHRRVAYQEDNLTALDWERASGSLGEVNPGIVDIESLRNRTRSAHFFLDEISRRVRAAGRPEILIVLSNSVEFQPGQELLPIALDSRTGARVFYIRYQTFPPPYFNRSAPRARIEMPDGTRPARGRRATPIDQLEPLLKPLEPRLFDVATPEQFRRALAAILEEISRI